MDNSSHTLAKPQTLEEAFRLGISKIPNDYEYSLCLVPVGPWIIEDHELIREMARQRYQSQESFFKYYPNSPKMLANYILECPIQEADRILFMIYCNEKFAGHLGLANIGFENATIDNVLKFAQSPKGLAKISLETVMAWANQSLSISNFTLSVRADNEKAMRLYQGLGFQKKSETLIELQEYDETKACLVRVDKFVTKVEMICYYKELTRLLS